MANLAGRGRNGAAGNKLMVRDDVSTPVAAQRQAGGC